MSSSKIVLFAADGTVLLFKLDTEHKLFCSQAPPSQLEFEPNLVAAFAGGKDGDCKVVASSPGFVSVINFSADLPKVETTKRKTKNTLTEAQVCLMPYFNFQTFPFVVQRLKQSGYSVQDIKTGEQVAFVPSGRGKIEILGSLHDESVLIALDKTTNKSPQLKFIEFALA